MNIKHFSIILVIFFVISSIGIAVAADLNTVTSDTVTDSVTSDTVTDSVTSDLNTTDSNESVEWTCTPTIWIDGFVKKTINNVNNGDILTIKGNVNFGDSVTLDNEPIKIYVDGVYIETIRFDDAWVPQYHDAHVAYQLHDLTPGEHTLKIKYEGTETHWWCPDIEPTSVSYNIFVTE